MRNFISKEQVKELLNDMENEISIQELSKWLKSKTDNEFVIMPRFFCVITVTFFEEKAKENSGKFPFLKELVQELRELKNYL